MPRGRPLNILSLDNPATLAGSFGSMVGRRFGRLLIIGPAPSVNGAKHWLCQCSCGGNVTTASEYKLRHRATISCGCWGLEKRVNATRKHGKRHTPEYSSWSHMRARCLCPTNHAYGSYGGRGISICARWLGGNGFINFLTDMGPRPSANHSLDRWPDNNGNYEPDNCRWATKVEQARNRRSNRLVKVGDRLVPLAEACESLGLDFEFINSRLQSNFTFERALSQPKRERQ